MAQELDWLLKMASASTQERASLYERWEPESPCVADNGIERQLPLSQFLMDVYHQGRVAELLTTLQQLLEEGIRPNLNEFTDLVQEIVRRPWFLSQRELEIVKHLQHNPTASAEEIACRTGSHRKTVAHHLRRLFYALQILPYPLINYPAVGLRHIQFWYRGTIKLPSSVYFFSRLSLMSNPLRKGWLIDTWKVPIGQENRLIGHYQQLERTGHIQNVVTKEVLSLGKHLSLAAYEPRVGWRLEPSLVKLMLQRALKGREIFTPQFMELMVYDATGTPPLDAMDMRIIGTLIDDYLLSQSKEGLSLQLGISRADLDERLDQLESNRVIRPTLGVKAEKMAQVVLRIPLTESQVLNALMRLPVVFFSLIESRDTGKREWLVFVKCPYAVAEMLTNSQWSKGIPLTSYSVQRLAFQSQRRLFASYDDEQNGWPPELLLQK